MGILKQQRYTKDFLNKKIQDNSDLTIEDYCDFLHNQNSGFVTVSTKDEKENWVEKTYSVSEWFNHIEIDEKKGCFASLATFFIPKRNTNTLREISMVYVDLDTRNVGISNDDAIEQIDFLVETERLPEPTVIVASGSGLYALWKIESVPGRFKKVRELYKYVEETLIEELKELGADEQASDATRVLRVPGSYNEKYSKEVKVVRFKKENHYTLRYFQEFSNEINDIDWEEVQNEIKERKKRKRARKKAEKTKKKSKLANLFNRYTLAIARSADFETLISVRKYDMSGLANTILHMYAIEQMKIHKDKLVMKSKLSEFNSKLKNSHCKKEIQYIADSVARYYLDWNYYNSTIIKKLKITPEEMKFMKTLIDSNEKNERQKEKKKKNRRNEMGLTSREQAKLDLINQVKELKQKGFTQNETAAKLKRGIATVKRHWNA